MALNVNKGSSFEEKVADLLRLLGYEVKLNTLVDGGQIDIRAEIKSGIITQKLLIECKCYESKPVGIADVNKFCSRVTLARQSSQADFGILVSNTDFTAEAKSSIENYDFVQLKTYRQLMSEMINFESYIKRFIYDYEHYEEYSEGQRQPIVEILNRCNLYKYYVDLRCIAGSGDRYDPVDNFFGHWLKDPERNHVTLLGDYGTGKSSFALHLTYQLAKKYIEDPANSRIPLFISLRDYSKAINVQQLVTDLLINRYNIQLSSYNVFRKFLESGKMVLIFDGFDEMATKVDKETTLRNFDELSTVVTPNSKTILTCRTHYFKSRAHVIDLFSPPQDTDLMLKVRERRDFEVIELEEFNNDQIISLLKKRTDDWMYYWGRIRSLYNLEDLARRPILLDMIIKTLPALVKKGLEIDQAALYDEYTSYWIKREDWRSQMTQEEKEDFMENLAFQMFVTEQEWVHYTKLYNIVKQEFLDRVVTYSDVDYFDNDTRTCTFLNRDREGNYKFIHRSFMEFFVAEKLAKEIGNNKMDGLAPNAFSPEILQFLTSLLRDKKLAIRNLENALKLAKKKPVADVGFLGTNALSLLNYLGATLSHGDFSEIVLSHVDLSGADLKGTKFSRSKMQNANLDGADLSGADFSYADLSNVCITSLNPCMAIAYSPDGKSLAMGDSAGVIRIWDLGRKAVVRTFRNHQSQVFGLSYSPDGKSIASADGDQMVLVRNVKNGKLLLKLEANAPILWKLVYSADGDRIIAVGSDGYVRIWNASDGNLVHSIELEGERSSLWTISCHPREEDFAIGGRGRKIEIYSLRNFEQISVLRGFEGCISDLCYSKDGKFLASVADDGLLKIWDVNDGKEISEIKVHSKHEAVRFVPDSDLIVVAGNAPDITVYDVRSGREIHDLREHSDSVNCLTVSPDGGYVVSGSYDGTAKVWNPLSGECLFTLGVKTNFRKMNIENAEGLTQLQIDDLIRGGAVGRPGRKEEADVIEADEIQLTAEEHMGILSRVKSLFDNSRADQKS